MSWGQRERNKKKWIFILSAVLAVAVIAAVIVIAVMLNKKEKPADADVPSSVNTAKIITMRDSSLGEIWVPVREELAKNSYNPDQIDTRRGLKTYNENGVVVSTVGVDVSYFQKEIDWKKVKADGIDFAMIRLGLRGYGTGAIVMDEDFEYNIKNALEAGLDVGVYFFSQATSPEEAKEEAEYVIDVLKDYEITYPVVFDLEVIRQDNSRTNELSARTMTEACAAFCKKIKDAGYQPMYYANKKCAVLKYDMAQLSDYDLWYVDYNDTFDFPYEFAMWQYTNKGTVDGIEGEVDLNLCFKKYGK